MTSLPIRYLVNIEGEWFSNFSPANKNKSVAEYCRTPRLSSVSLRRSADNAKSSKNIYFNTTIKILNSDHYFDLIGKDYDGKTLSIYRTDRAEEVSDLSEMLLVFSGTIDSIVVTETTLSLSCLDVRDKDLLIEVPEGSVVWYLTYANSFAYAKANITGKSSSSVEPTAFRWTDKTALILDPLGIGAKYENIFASMVYSAYLGAPWADTLYLVQEDDSSGNSITDGRPSVPIDIDLGGDYWVSLNLNTGDVMTQAFSNGSYYPTALASINTHVGTDDSYNLNIIDAVILHLNKALGVTYDSSNYNLTAWGYWRTYFRDEDCYHFSGFYDKSYSCVDVSENILASLNLTLFTDNDGLLSLHEFGTGYIKHIIKQSDVLNRPEITYDDESYLYSITVTSNFGGEPKNYDYLPSDGKDLNQQPYAPWLYNLNNSSYLFPDNGDVVAWFTPNDIQNPTEVVKTYVNDTEIQEFNKNTLDLTLPYVNQIDYNPAQYGNRWYPEDYHWFRLQDRLDYFNWIPATTEIKVKSIEGFQLYDLIEYDIDRVDDTSWLITGIDYDTNIVKLKKEKESLILGYDLYENELTVDTRDEGITFVDPALDREA